MIRKIGLLLVCIFLLNDLFAQNAGFSVSGKVSGDGGDALAGANVVLLQQDNKLVKADLTDNGGLFKIEHVKTGDYILKITLTGFQVYTSEKITVKEDYVLPDVKLEKKAGTLDEVSVRGQKPFIEVKADMLVVNVENSIVSAGSSAMEVLQRSPGVTVDQNDNISLKGKPGVTIMIDGKITPFAGTDLANILKSMPASSIDKIELISNPGARYDAAGTAGIINIRTRKDKRMGVNGSINASYGQGVYPKYGAGINLNYRNKKLNVNLTYNYAYRLWFNHLMLDRRFYDSIKTDQQRSAFIQDNNALFDFSNHIGGLSIDYSLSKKTTIGFSVNGSSNTFSPKADNYSKSLDANDAIDYYFNTTGRHQNHYTSFAANLNLRHNFDSTGRSLSVDVDYAEFGSQTNQHFRTDYIGIDGEKYQDPYFLKSDLSGSTKINSFKADYDHPLKNNLKLSAGVKTSFVISDNDPFFYDKTGDADTISYQLDSSRTNHFVYTENINAAYLSLNKDWEKWSVQVGIRAEQTNLEGDQRTLKTKHKDDYIQLFPSFAIQRHINPNNDLGVSLSRRIQRPDYQQLNPFKFFIDKTTYKEGYPSLAPALSYTLDVSYTYKQRYVTTATYSVTDNIITQVIQPSENDEGDVTVQTDRNLSRMYFYGVGGSYTTPITKWWTNVTNYNVYYSHYDGFIANSPLSKGGVTCDIYTNNSFILPWDFSAELGFFYQAPQVYGYMDVEPNSSLNAGLQKNILHKKATIRFSADDILWKGYPSATSTYKGYREFFVAERDTRQFTLTFTYRFGNKPGGPIRRRSGAEDEVRRAGSGGA